MPTLAVAKAPAQPKAMSEAISLNTDCAVPSLQPAEMLFAAPRLPLSNNDRQAPGQSVSVTSIGASLRLSPATMHMLAALNLTDPSRPAAV